MADFIFAVFGITKDDLNHCALGYTLPEEYCRDYNDGSYASHSSHERSAYAPLMNIFEGLGNQLEGNVKNRELNGSNFINVLDREVFDNFAKDQPDFLTSCIDYSTSMKRPWNTVATTGLLTKSQTIRKDLEGHSYDIDLNRVPEASQSIPLLGIITERCRYRPNTDLSTSQSLSLRPLAEPTTLMPPNVNSTNSKVGSGRPALHFPSLRY